MDENYIIKIEKDGYKEVYKDARTKVSPEWLIADVICGVLPIAIDALTGSWKTLDTKEIEVYLDKK